MGKVATYIEINEPTDLLKNQLALGPPYLLDVSVVFALSLTKLLEELNDFGSIKKDAVLPVTLPYSDINNLVLEKYAWTNVGNASFGPLAIRVVSGAKTWHYDSLYVLESNDETQEFLCEIAIQANHWVTQAAQLKISEIVAADFVINYANILARQNVQKWSDGDPLHQWPLAHYGVDDASHRFLRPWFYATAIIQEGLCMLGWNLDSEFLQSDYMRKFLLYILKADWQTYGGKGTASDVYVGVDPLLVPNNDHAFPTVLVTAFSIWIPFPPYVNPGWYNDATPIPVHEDWAYVNKSAFPVTVDCTLFMEIEINAGHAGPGFPQLSICRIAHYDTVPALQSYAEDTFLVAGAPITFTYNIVFNNITLQPSDSIRVQTNGGKITTNSYLSINAQEDKQTIDGDIMQLGTLVEPDMTLLDAMAGVAHIWNLKFSTLWGTQTLGIYLPETRELPSLETAEGFFKTDEVPFNISDKVICESMARIYPIARPARYVRLKFITSTDVYNTDERGVVSLVTQPYQKFIDLGEGLTEEEALVVNPLFEPTLHAEALGFMGGLLTGIPAIVPYLWDNADGNNSCNIKPRIIYYTGNAEQVAGSDSSRVWERDGILMLLVPTGAQQLDYTTDLDPVAGSNAIYGDLQGGDGYSLGWEVQLRELAWALTVTLKMIMCLDAYERMNFRELLYFTYRGIPHVHKLLAIEAFTTNEFAPTTLLLRAPVNSFVPFCGVPCTLPCDGAFVDCMYNSDIGNQISDATISGIEICEAIFNGIQYVTGPCVPLGATVNLTSVGGNNVVTNFITALNGMGIPHITASLPTPLDLSSAPAAGTQVESEGRAFRIKSPTCWEWEIELWVGEMPFMRITEKKSYTWVGGAWVELNTPPFGVGYYPFAAQNNCIFTNDCP